MRSQSPKKRKEPPEGSARTRARSKVPALSAYWLSGLVNVALVMLLAFGAGAFAWMENEEANRLQQLEGFSSIVVREFGSRVASLQGRLREWGADPQLRKAFLTSDSEDLRAREEWLALTLPDVVRVRLMQPGACGGKESKAESLSYAGLDLICEAERKRSVTLLEVHRLGRPEEHLAIAAPVLDEAGEAVLGVIHLALPTTLVPSTGDVSGEWGRILFQQRVADQAVAVASGRRGTTPPGTPDYEERVEGTRLRVAAWVNSGGVLDAGLLQRLAVAYLVLMAFIALAGWVPLRRLRRALTVDLKAVVALVQDAMNKKPVPRLQCRLAETEPVIEELAGLVRDLQPDGGLQVAAEQADATTDPTAEMHTDGPTGAVGVAASQDSTGSEPVLRAEVIPAEIFRAYDIRGIVDSHLTDDLMRAIGLAVGTEVGEAGDQTVILGRDTRPSSEGLSKALVAGLRTSGCDVLDLGIVPTPLIYFATHYQGETSGVMVTASHNPENYNGLKVVVSGATLAGKRIEALRERILAGDFSRGEGRYRIGEIITDYVRHVEMDIAIARTLKVIVDCGNAAAAVVAPQLYGALGCDLVELNCDPKAGFPGGRIPDTSRPECLEALRHAVVSQEADIGLAFDADGDRLGVVDSSGKIIWPDRVLMLLAADVLSRHPGGDVIFDVKSSHHLATEILRHGGRPVMCRSGHAPLKAKLQETGALLAGEWSGHIIFRERWFGFDDALYAGARLLEVLALDPRSSAEVFAELPEAMGTPELFLHLAEGESTQIMKAVLEQAAQLRGYDLNTDDGLRAETELGWGLVRASNTQPALVFRFEADDEAGLSRIQDEFRRLMERAAPELKLPF